MSKELEERPPVLLICRAIIIDNREGLKILLIQRSADDEYRPNRWEFPGGKVDRGNDLVSAIDQEIGEETGLKCRPINRLAHVDAKILCEGRYKGFLYVGITGIYTKEGGTERLSREHQDSNWLTIEKVLNCDPTEETREAFLVLLPLVINYLKAL